MRRVRIGNRWIGEGEPTYLIAELSANHNGSFEEAVRLVHAAKAAGAEAVKIQTYTADTLTIDSEAEPFRIQGTIWDGRTLYELYGEAHTPWEWQPKLKEIADELGLALFSSPFDGTAVEFLERMGVPAYKIASFEIVDLPLLRRVAATGKPVIVSTGMATLPEIEEAVQTLDEAGCRDVALLKCTSAYPAPPESMNLRTIPDLAARFGVPVGLSDHTLGATIPVAAVALGACLIEKHFTLSRAAGGPDSAFSLEPSDFRSMADAVRSTERAMGEARYGPTPEEMSSLVFRRSLFVVEDVAKGELFTERNVRSIRPGHGLHPRHLAEVLGKAASKAVKRGTPLAWELVASSEIDDI